jgi:hypothetical protein
VEKQFFFFGEKFCHFLTKKVGFFFPNINLTKFAIFLVEFCQNFDTKKRGEKKTHELQ